MAGASSITQFLSHAQHDFDVEYQDKKIDYLERSPANIPLIDEVEFRVRNEGYEFDRQRYEVRLQPSGFGETIYGHRLHDAWLAYEQDAREELINRGLKKRYQLVVEYLYRISVLELDLQLQVLYTDRLKVLDKKKDNLDSDPDKYLKASGDCTDMQIKVLRQRNDIAELRNEILLCLPQGDSANFDTAQMIGIDDIDSVLTHTAFHLDTNNVYVRRNYARLKVEECRYRLENAQTRQFISYIEFGYDRGVLLDEIERREDGRSFRLVDSHIMGLGVTLPIINTNKLDVQRRKLNLLDQQGEYEDLKQQLGESMRKTIADMKNLIAEYKILAGRKNEISNEAYMNAYLQVDGVDPSDVLKAKERIIDNQCAIERMRLDLYREYIKLLDVTGMLSKKPLINHVSRTREPLMP